MIIKNKPKHLKMTYDIVFKKFFTDKPDLLKLILKHFLGIDSIKNLTIINPEIPELEKPKQSKKPILKTKKEKLCFLDSSLPTETTKGKRVFLDLRVKLSTGEDINVEVQTSYKKYFLNRILYYWARLHAQTLKTGEGYENITPTYSLIFTEQSFLGSEVKSFLSSFSIRGDDEPYILFNKDLKIVVVELGKLKKTRAELVDFKEFWCYFIKESDKLTREDRKSLSRHKELEEAMDHFDKLSKEERLKNIALDRHMTEVIHNLDRSGWIQQGREEGREEGREQGREEGREEGQINLILKMLEKGCSILEVSKMTDLPESKIRKIKNKQKR